MRAARPRERQNEGNSMNFNRPIAENIRENGMPFVAAHRGVCGANIPCNTLEAYQIAVNQGAEVVELDVTKSADGEYFAFHPGMERVFLKCGRKIPEMTAKEVREQPLLNFDEVPTHYRVPTLREALGVLRDRVYINVDKFWTDVEGITREIRACGVEKQVIVKTPGKEEYLAAVEKYAPDLMYMAVLRGKDEQSELLLCRSIHYIGAEVLFSDLSEEVASAAYIKKMHEKGLLLWVNAIVYNEKDIITADLTDDVSLVKGSEYGWDRLAEMGYDFIQTDFPLALKAELKRQKMAKI